MRVTFANSDSAPQQQYQCSRRAPRTLCGDPRRTAISDRYHPPEFFVRPSQSSASQSYSSHLIYFWRFRGNSMTSHLIEDRAPPLALHVGDWKAALPMGVTFCSHCRVASAGAGPLFDAPASTAWQEQRRFVSITACQMNVTSAGPTACIRRSRRK